MPDSSHEKKPMVSNHQEIFINIFGTVLKEITVENPIKNEDLLPLDYFLFLHPWINYPGINKRFKKESYKEKNCYME
jgi:hypothetical protein